MKQSGKFDKNNYINSYKKEHYKVFKVELKHDDYNELDSILSDLKLTKKQFVINALDDLKNISLNKKKNED